MLYRLPSSSIVKSWTDIGSGVSKIDSHSGMSKIDSHSGMSKIDSHSGMSKIDSHIGMSKIATSSQDGISARMRGRGLLYTSVQ